MYRFGKYIPEKATPNQVTLVGAIGGLIAIISMFLVNISSLFFIPVILGVITHIVADDLDGYVARRRNMSSKAGAYFDLIVDVVFSTFLVIALGFSGYAHLEIAVFFVPTYSLIVVTMVHYIMHLKEFLFPRVGPFEAHASYIIIAVGCMIFGKSAIITILNLPLSFADLVMIIAIIPIYYEMIRLQIQLFRRLKTIEKSEI